MRCNTCNFENPPNEQYCQRCKTPLSTAAEKLGSGHESLREEGTSLRDKTVPGKLPDKPYLDIPFSNYQSGNFSGVGLEKEIKCPHCGYPNDPEMKLCIKCKKPIHDNHEDHRSKTIDPYTQSKQTLCKLKPVPRTGEKELAFAEFISSDSPIILNQSNTEKNNKTISEKGHAKLDFQDGKWYLSDQSTAKTTFLLLSGPTELKNGDIILLGDRKFIVEI